MVNWSSTSWDFFIAYRFFPWTKMHFLALLALATGGVHLQQVWKCCLQKTAMELSPHRADFMQGKDTILVEAPWDCGMFGTGLKLDACFGLQQRPKSQTFAVVCRFANEVSKANWRAGGLGGPAFAFDSWPALFAEWWYLHLQISENSDAWLQQLQVASTRSVYHFQLTGCKHGLTGGIAAQQSVYATTLPLSQIRPRRSLFWHDVSVKRSKSLLHVAANLLSWLSLRQYKLADILLVAAVDASL